MAGNMSDTADYENVRPNRSSPPAGLLLSGHFHCQYGYRVLRPKGGGSWLLFFTEAGRGFIQQPGVRRVVGNGDLDLLAPDAYSDYGVPPSSSTTLNKRRFLQDASRIRGPQRMEGWRFHWTHFRAQAQWRNLMDWPEWGSGWRHLTIRNPAVRRRIAQAFTRLHVDLRLGGVAAEALAQTGLQEILWVIARETGQLGRNQDPRVREALERIQRDLAAAHSVADLARKANLSPSRFAHLFKEQTGESVTPTKGSFCIILWW